MREIQTAAELDEPHDGFDDHRFRFLFLQLLFSRRRALFPAPARDGDQRQLPCVWSHALFSLRGFSAARCQPFHLLFLQQEVSSRFRSSDARALLSCVLWSVTAVL